MSDDVIHVEERDLTKLKNALQTAGENYRANIVRLQNLIDEITRGDIQGDPADVLKSKFEAKQNSFKEITKTIELAEDKMGIKKAEFVQLINDMPSTMR